MRLEHRKILISGAASGIGRAIATLFVREGSSVALIDRDGQGLEALARELEDQGDTKVSFRVADVAEAGALGDAVGDTAQAIGGLDGVVAAAGIDCLKPFEEMTVADWEVTLAVNLSGPFNLCHAALPFLRRSGAGTIVQVASGAALRPLASRTAYCAAKAGQVMFAKALAVDLAPHSIRVNAICPGIIDTPLFRSSFESAAEPEAEFEQILGRYLIRRPGKPEDVANAALFLSCEESAHVTGSSLAVDGGRSFH